MSESKSKKTDRPAGFFLFPAVLVVLVAALIFGRFYTVRVVRRGDVGEGLSLGQRSDQEGGGLPEVGDADLAAARSFLKFRQIRASLVPSGVPEIYGPELGISFDQVQEAINKVRVFGPTYGQAGKKIILTGADLERYKKIGAAIACEYCCGVKTLTKEDGTAACGCAHSAMMRGLAAYLIKNHPEKFNDEEILEELGKWKATFFPKQTLSKKLAQMEQAGEEGVKEVLREFPDFLPQMVGGC